MDVLSMLMSHRMAKRLKLFIMRDLAKKICQYNGQKGTDKQIDKCLQAFKYSETLLLQFCNNRIKVN
jgi:hypothetical protein